MNVAILISFFLLGTIIGSFLNVVILRYHAPLSLHARSRCFSCGKTLRWYELIPILSFLLLRGRCLSCKSGISLQYVSVELATGLLFLGVFLKGYTGLNALIPLIALSALVVIFVYDIYHKIIPDGMVYLFIGISALQMFITLQPFSFTLPPLTMLIAGPLLFLPFFALWFVSRGTWMGLGDGKLALGIGWFLGLSKGVSAIIFAFWIGAAVSLLLLGLQKFLKRRSFFQKHVSLKSEVPFAPYLIAGFLIQLFFNVNIELFMMW